MTAACPGRNASKPKRSRSTCRGVCRVVSSMPPTVGGVGRPEGDKTCGWRGLSGAADAWRRRRASAAREADGLDLVGERARADAEPAGGLGAAGRDAGAGFLDPARFDPR